MLGGIPYVEEWEIAVLHRHHHSHQGACVRVAWMHGDPAGLDAALDVFKIKTLPALQNLEGFCSVSLFIDETNSRAVSSVTFDSREAMVATRGAGLKLRTETAAQAVVDILDVAEFDLLVAHLRVPEMA